MTLEVMKQLKLWSAVTAPGIEGVFIFIWSSLCYWSCNCESSLLHRTVPSLFWFWLSKWGEGGGGKTKLESNTKIGRTTTCAIPILLEEQKTSEERREEERKPYLIDVSGKESFTRRDHSTLTLPDASSLQDIYDWL